MASKKNNTTNKVSPAKVMASVSSVVSFMKEQISVDLLEANNKGNINLSNEDLKKVCAYVESSLTNSYVKASGQIESTLKQKVFMPGQRHLIECHCILPLYKGKSKTVYHKFAVYSLIDEKSGKVIPKYVNCNNCGVTHFINELCRSEIKVGKEDIKSVRSIEEVSLSIPDKLNNLLKEYNSSVDIYEEIEDVLENKEFPRSLVLKREIIDEKYQLKILNIISENKFKISSETLEDIIEGEK